jgi:hypothetical protein
MLNYEDKTYRSTEQFIAFNIIPLLCEFLMGEQLLYYGFRYCIFDKCWDPDQIIGGVKKDRISSTSRKQLLEHISHEQIDYFEKTLLKVRHPPISKILCYFQETATINLFLIGIVFSAILIYIYIRFYIYNYTIFFGFFGFNYLAVLSTFWKIGINMTQNWILRIEEICITCGHYCCYESCPPICEDRYNYLIKNGVSTDSFEFEGYRVLKEIPEAYKQQYLRAIENISNLVSHLKENELEAIHQIDEPLTEKGAEIPRRKNGIV